MAKTCLRYTCLLNAEWQFCHVYSGQEKVQRYKLYSLTLEKYRDLARQENIIFLIDTIRILCFGVYIQTVCKTQRVWHFPNMLPSILHCKNFCILSWQTLIEEPPTIRHLGTQLRGFSKCQGIYTLFSSHITKQEEWTDRRVFLRIIIYYICLHVRSFGWHSWNLTKPLNYSDQYIRRK